MNEYIERVLASVREKNASEPEFVQTVEEVFKSIAPVVERHPEYEKNGLLERLVEPERMFSFRIAWVRRLRRSLRLQRCNLTSFFI